MGQNSIQHRTIAQVQMPIIGAGQGDCCAHAPAVTQNTRRFLVQFDGIILPPFVTPAALLQQIWGRLDAGAAYVATPTLSVTDQDVPGHAPKGRAIGVTCRAAHAAIYRTLLQGRPMPGLQSRANTASPEKIQLDGLI
jgi:hypothetical protein